MVRKAPPRPAERARAFTLVELLVSMTVLTVMVLLISQLFSNTTSVTVGNRKRMDADGQARIVFDHIALDINKMLKRTDVDYLFAKIASSNGGGNDQLYFFSEAPAYYESTDSSTLNQRSSVALVGYRINKSYQLERLGKQLTWDGVPAPSSSPALPGGVVFLTPNLTTSADPSAATTIAGNWGNTIGSAPTFTPPDPADDNFQVLADQVYRLEFCFQLKDGTFSPLPVWPDPNLPQVNSVKPAQVRYDTTPPTITSDSTASPPFVAGSRWYDTQNSRGYICANNTAGAAVWNYLGMQDVRAVVVAIAVLDAASAKRLKTTPVTINGQSVDLPRFDLLSDAFADADIKDVTSPGSASNDPTVPSLPPITNGVKPAYRLMAEAWGKKLASKDFITNTGAPPSVAAQIRIYQRSFVLINQ